MKLVKLALISAIGLFLVIFFISLLFPSHVRISRAINITAPKDSITARLTDLRQWEHWNAVINNGEVLNKQYSKDRFTSNNVTVTLGAIQTDTITTNWLQQNGRDIASGFTLYEQNGTVVVQWYFDFHLKWYPWEKFGSMIFDKQLGPPMEYSLATLKKLLEETP